MRYRSRRGCYLGFQVGDLEDELLEAATPTPTRRAKRCFVQVVAAHHGFDLKMADVSGLFLQGREQQPTVTWLQWTSCRRVGDHMRKIGTIAQRWLWPGDGTKRVGRSRCTKDCRDGFSSVQDRPVLCESSSRKHRKGLNCKCQCFSALMTSCWLNVMLKLVGKISTKVEMVSVGRIFLRMTKVDVATSGRNFLMDQKADVDKRVTQLRSNPNDGRRQKHP